MTDWAARHPAVTDVLVALLVGAASLAGYLTASATGSERSQDAIGAVLIVGQTVAFAFRRSNPLTSFAVVSTLTMAFWVSDYPTNVDVFSLLTVYAATAHGGPNRTKVWRVVGTGVGGFTAVALLGVLSPSEDLPAAAVIGISIVHVTAAVTGEIIYDRRRRLFEFEQRAIRAENERLLMARQAVLDERATIARDLHDVVAHGMSVMIVQAGAAERMLTRDPDAATEALRHIQAAGREALSEMRRMLAVLRDEHSSSVELSPQPTMSDLEQVVRRCSDAGVPTELVTEGEMPAGAVGESMAAYRVAQEALTNVIKHAGSSARAIVKVQYRPDRIVVEVLDTGAGASDAMLRASTGHGFVGMRERVDLYGGTLRFGPRPGGGFRVVATIPLTRVAASRRFEVAR